MASSTGAGLAQSSAEDYVLRHLEYAMKSAQGLAPGTDPVADSWHKAISAYTIKPEPPQDASKDGHRSYTKPISTTARSVRLKQQGHKKVVNRDRIRRQAIIRNAKKASDVVPPIDIHSTYTPLPLPPVYIQDAYPGTVSRSEVYAEDGENDSSAVASSSAESSSAPIRKKKIVNRSTITDTDRQIICNHAHSHPHKPHAEIAQMFGLERSTISKILKRKNEWIGINIWTEFPSHVAQHRSPKFPELEVQLRSRLLDITKEDKPLTDRVIRSTARDIAGEMGIDEQFKASVSWVESFKKRHEISEGKLVNPDAFEKLIAAGPPHLTKSSTSPESAKSPMQAPTATDDDLPSYDSMDVDLGDLGGEVEADNYVIPYDFPISSQPDMPGPLSADSVTVYHGGRLRTTTVRDQGFDNVDRFEFLPNIDDGMGGLGVFSYLSAFPQFPSDPPLPPASKDGEMATLAEVQAAAAAADSLCMTASSPRRTSSLSWSSFSASSGSRSSNASWSGTDELVARGNSLDLNDLANMGMTGLGF